MRVLHITSNFNNVLFSKLFNSLHHLGVSQTVFYPYITGDGSHPEILNNEIGIIVRRGVHPFLRHCFILRGLINYRNLVREINVQDFDIIHCHTLYNDGLIGLFIRLRYKKRLVCSIRQSDVTIKRMKFWLYLFIPIIKKFSTSLISLNPSIRDEFAVKDSAIIGNGIDDIFLSDRSVEKISDNGRTKLIYVGRLIRRKNIDFLIDFVSKNRGDFDLTVVGSGVKQDTWLNNVERDLENLSNVTHRPYLTPDNLVKELDTADIFILPSFNETWGIVYLEAMARALPVIYMHGTGIDGYFGKSVGGALKKLDGDTLIALINNIEMNRSEIAMNCKEYARGFHWSIIATDILNIYRNAMTTKTFN